MLRHGALVVVVALLVLVAPFTGLLLVQDDESHRSPQGPPAGLDDGAGTAQPQTQPTSDGRHHETPTVEREVAVVVELKADYELPDEREFVVEEVYTRERDRLVQGTASLSAVQRLTQDPRIRAVQITSPDRTVDPMVAPGVTQVGADRFHARGVVGQNVTVGVIDSGFRVDHPAIAGNVGSYRSFGSVGDWEHGTAVASVVADTAPGAQLHLAAVGPSTTESEYAAAVEWLQESGADVIVDAGSYYGQPGNGSGEIATVAAAAAEETVFVTSVGNHAQRYWTGNHTGTGYVAFGTGIEGNRLVGTVSGQVHVSLRWDDWPETETDYDLYLFRDRPGRDTLVASATGHDGRPYASLTTTVPEGNYYVSVRAVEPAEDGNTSLELFANQAFEYRSPGGRASPATAAGVIAVGASENGTVREFSAAGADLVAPDSVAVTGVSVDGGTSFAAPYVAGTAALVLSERPDLSPGEVDTLMRLSATDIGPAGDDLASGRGELNAATIDGLLSLEELRHDTGPR